MFLDESGDLGWTLDKPYRAGGSSRFLTIAGICCEENRQHIPARTVRQLYSDCGWNPKLEKKWTHMDAAERTAFAHLAKAMLEANPDITAHAIVVNKSKVMGHIRVDPNKLYNYAIGCCMLEHLSRFEAVTLVPDPRSVKVASGNALPDYLQMKLAFDLSVPTRVVARPRDSKQSLQIQFVDMLAGLVQARYEDAQGGDLGVVENQLRLQRMYFQN